MPSLPERSTRGLQSRRRPFLDAGDWVLIWLWITGRGRGSGVEVEMHQAWTYLLRDGKVVRTDAFLDKAKALQAIVLSA